MMTDAKPAHTAKSASTVQYCPCDWSTSECKQTLQLDMEAIFFVCPSVRLSVTFLETLVVLSVVHGLQDQHVELFRVAAGTVAPW